MKVIYLTILILMMISVSCKTLTVKKIPEAPGHINTPSKDRN